MLHEENAAVHVSGHANQEEIRTLYGLVRPKAVMPIHGEYRMQAANARMAQEAGVPANAIVMAENGSVVELSAERGRGSSTGSRPASPSSTGSASATSATSRSATGGTWPRTAS